MINNAVVTRVKSRRIQDRRPLLNGLRLRLSFSTCAQSSFVMTPRPCRKNFILDFTKHHEISALATTDLCLSLAEEELHTLFDELRV